MSRDTAIEAFVDYGCSQGVAEGYVDDIISDARRLGTGTTRTAWLSTSDPDDPYDDLWSKAIDLALAASVSDK